MLILGISCFYHDSAACLVKDGVVWAAAQEERFSRVKHDSSFPAKSVQFCLDFAGVGIEDVDYVVFYEKPFLKFERLLETYIQLSPRGLLSFCKALPLWLKEKLNQGAILERELKSLTDAEINWSERIRYSEHHLSHAASAFFPSPFDEALILTMDGVGEWATSSVFVGKDGSLELVKELRFPHSLGLLYSAFTYFCGFKVNSGEYKLMGLAPYGTPRFAKKIKDNLIFIKPDGSFRLNLKYFDFATGFRMTSPAFDKLFEGEPRQPETEISQREMDIAASIQAVTEEIVLTICKSLRQEFGIKNLCMAGGVALNCVANGKLVESGIFDDIWIQPAAGDAGGALGAALAFSIMDRGAVKNIRGNYSVDPDAGYYLGPEYSDEQIEETLRSIGAEYSKVSTSELVEIVSQALVDQKSVGWMQGRMEFGPRALGSRSILADPRSPEMQRDLNLKIKFRESFRPFAPSILKKKCHEWFDINCESPFMLIVAKVRKEKLFEQTEELQNTAGFEKLKLPRSQIPAVTHVDCSARVQTVDENSNPLFGKLIEAFFNKTGCPILVNTSFNVRGEPIVCDPKDAFNCFMGTNLDLLAMGHFIVHKSEQPSHLANDYKQEYELD